MIGFQYEKLHAGKPVWVVRARNWKLWGGENRLSGLLEGVSIVSSGRQGSKGDRVKPLFKFELWYRYQGRVSVPKPPLGLGYRYWHTGIDTSCLKTTFGFDSGIPRVTISGRSCDWTGSRGLHRLIYCF
ncbi:hypothetical protein GQ457_03G014700 [Hibiscus cannabinus]